MSKIYVEIAALGNGKAYEFSVDETMKVGELLEEATAQIMMFEAGNISFDKSLPLICTREYGPLAPEMPLWQAGIKSGQKLLLL